jgi:hypothetical protein
MYLRYMTSSARDALVQKLRERTGANATQKAAAAAWLQSQLEWEHQLAQLRGRPMSCSHEMPPARSRDVA